MRVSPNFPKTLQEDVEPRFNSNSDYHDYVQQQVVEIESPQTTADALKLLGAKRSLWQRPGETDYRAAERLMWALKVQAVAGTYLITVGLEGKRAKGLAEIVNAVVASYLARQQGQEPVHRGNPEAGRWVDVRGGCDHRGATALSGPRIDRTRVKSRGRARPYTCG